jgi:hypothetical protein
MKAIDETSTIVDNICWHLFSVATVNALAMGPYTEVSDRTWKAMVKAGDRRIEASIISAARLAFDVE